LLPFGKTSNMKTYPFVIAASLGIGLLSLTSCAGDSKVSKEIVEEINIEKIIDGDEEPGLIHVVHFWLTDGLSEAEKKDFLRGVWSLEAIPAVKRMFVGPAASTPSRGVVDNSFDYSLIVYFDDVAGHDVYQEHPIHLKFVADHEAKFKTVQVKDSSPKERF